MSKPVNDLIERNAQNQIVLSEFGHRVMNQYVTSTTDSIYAIRENLSNTISSAAMARLSRSPDDLRVIIASEFPPEIDPSDYHPDAVPKPVSNRRAGEIELLRRVITSYGDDSVQQLGYVSVVVENASNILTKLLERPRIGFTCIERSTRYILFDVKITGEDGVARYRYMIPPELDAEAAAQFVQTMDQIFDLYSEIVRTLISYISENSIEPLEKRDAAWRSAVRAQACDAARSVLPLCTTSTVGITASAQAMDSLIMHLRASTLEEANQTGNQLLHHVRQIEPVFFERTDMPDRGEATSAYLRETQNDLESEIAKVVREVAPDRDPQGEDIVGSKVELKTHWPKNELHLADRILKAKGRNIDPDLLTNEQRKRIIRAYVGLRLNRRQKPGRIFEIPHYEFSFRTGYAEFRDLQRHRLVDAFEWGVVRALFVVSEDIPVLITQAGLLDQFYKAVSLSINLYRDLEEKGYSSKVCQYASLFVHKIDWTWTINLREAMHVIELRTTPQGHPAYRKLCQQMYQQICNVHPFLGSMLCFVNCGEDPELTRLAAERATAAKLAKLNIKT